MHDTCPRCKVISENISTLPFKFNLGHVALMRFGYLSQTESKSTPAQTTDFQSHISRLCVHTAQYFCMCLCGFICG